jgi:protein SCO1/2
MSLARLRLGLWVLLGLVAAGLVVFLWRHAESEQSAVTQTSMATIGGPFTQTASRGKPFSSAELNGKPAAIIFGFTHCPDNCPTTLSRMAK